MWSGVGALVGAGPVGVGERKGESGWAGGGEGMGVGTFGWGRGMGFGEEKAGGMIGG